MLERIDDSAVQERALFVLDAGRIDGLAALAGLPCKHFACLVAWDADSSGIAMISRLAEVLVDFGAVFIATWGRACERVHDGIDEVVVQREMATGIHRPVIMTTWHADETLESALWFLTFAASPDDAYLETCKATVAISISSSECAAEMRTAFGDLTAFNTLIVDRPPGAA